jgi:hypothetical protein
MDSASAAAHLADLYARDRLVVHSIPEPLVSERPSHLADAHTMLSCSVLFHEGTARPGGRRVPNAVARFGDDAHCTNYGTLHDLDLIWNVGGGAAGGCRAAECIAMVRSPRSLASGRRTAACLAPPMQVHERLEAAKPPQRRGRAFVYFASCDMCDLSEAMCGGQPPKCAPAGLPGRQWAAGPPPSAAVHQWQACRRLQPAFACMPAPHSPVN